MSLTSLAIIALFLLNVAFMGAIWHMDVQKNMEEAGKRRTSGIFKISVRAAYRYSQYFLILTLILTDLLFVSVRLR